MYSIIEDVRTTLNLDDDALQMVKTYAGARSLALGKAASELIRQGIQARRPTHLLNGVLVVALPHDSPKVTSEQVKRLESENW